MLKAGDSAKVRVGTLGICCKLTLLSIVNWGRSWNSSESAADKTTDNIYCNLAAANLERAKAK